MIGDLEFSYRVLPLDASITNADMIRLQDSLQTGFHASSIPIAAESDTPAPSGFMELEGEHCCLSILKRPESGEPNAVIVRLSNYTSVPDRATLKFFRE